MNNLSYDIKLNSLPSHSLQNIRLLRQISNSCQSQARIEEVLRGIEWFERFEALEQWSTRALELGIFVAWT